MRERLIAWVESWVGAPWGHVLVLDQPVLSAIGGVVAVALAARWAKREGLVWWKVLVAGASCALFGNVLARVVWAATEWQKVAQDWGLLFDPFRGGQVSFGAMAGAALGAWVALRLLLKAPVWPYADVLAPAGVLGIAFARVGCLVRACDYGSPSSLPWAVQYPVKSNVFRRHLHEGWIERSDSLSLPVHPFPLYLAAWDALCFVVAWRWPQLWGKKPGQRALGAGMMMMVGRFAFEFFRQPGNAPRVLGPLNLGHALALGCLLALAALWGWRASQGEGEEAPRSS